MIIDKIIKIVKEPSLYRRLLSMDRSGYLYDIGWIGSYRGKIPVDRDNNPLPWVTYSFIDFIEGRLDSGMDIFEYGSGNSTLWYAKRVSSVTSIEHDMGWYERVRLDMPSNITLYHQELIYGGEYSKFVNSLDIKFDIIIVDGRDRVNSIKESIDNLKEGGIIVLDDSEREAYQDGVEFLHNNSFKSIDFWGISPGLFYKKSTTIFYKPSNCLGI